jgi:glycosyltransferase involved in cell wall biosynthesis
VTRLAAPTTGEDGIGLAVPARPRVAQIVGATEGADWLLPICRGLRARGFEVCAIVGAARGGLATRLAAAGIPVVPTPLSFGERRKAAAYACRLPDAVVRLARLLRQLRVDIAHSHLFNAVLIGRLAAWTARVPIRVAMIPGPAHVESRFTARLDRLTGWIDHRTVAGCEYTRSLYRAMGVPASRLTRIYYGADASRFDAARADGARVRRELGVAPDTPLVGQVAHFYPPGRGLHVPASIQDRAVKAQDDFLEAGRHLRDRIPGVRMLLVGHGWTPAGERYRRDLETRCRAAGLGDAVTFTGFRSDVPDVLAALDVAVQCSLSEGLGGTIEALLMGVPTVATAVGGMPEAVRDGETGRLVPPGQPAALADAVAGLLSEPARARAMAQAGCRAMLAGFTMERTIADIDALYRTLMRERRGPFRSSSVGSALAS